jgi:uncharacterized integral membrane protein (TIGR00697 family)
LNLSNRKDIVFLVLAGFFITNAIVAELIAGKIFELGPFVLSLGILLWPIVFLTTDLVNEYYGKDGVKKLTYITVGLISYMFIVITIGLYIKPASYSSVSEENYNKVFGPSQWIIVGSILAFISSQLIDVFIFWIIRDKTGSKMIWFRATGSTLVSQLIDTFVVQYIGFVLPGAWTMDQFWHNASYTYVFKLMIAIVLTPLIYVGHHYINKYIGEKESHDQIQSAAEETLHHKVTDPE